MSTFTRYIYVVLTSINLEDVYLHFSASVKYIQLALIVVYGTALLWQCSCAWFYLVVYKLSLNFNNVPIIQLQHTCYSNKNSPSNFFCCMI